MKFDLKKIIRNSLFLFLFFFANQAFATGTSVDFVNAYLFYGDGCPHCAQEKEFLYKTLKVKYPNLRIYEYEIYKNRQNTYVLKDVADKLGVRVDGVPFLVIGDEHFIGYADGITSESIEQRVDECFQKQCPDSIAKIEDIFQGKIQEQKITTPSVDKKNEEEIPAIETEKVSKAPIPEEKPACEQTDKDKKIVKIPLIGEINILSFSLPILTIIMGALDGFNPCAMWTLLFLISLLLGIKDRKRMWLLGLTFILSSAFVYFLFMSAWLNLVLFLGFVVWVRLLIGGLAILGGGYSLKEFIFNKKGGCKITGSEKRQKVFEKMKLLVRQNSLWFSLGGIILLAFAVNLVELICSAGLPAVYTQVLAINNISPLSRYLYIFGYILFFMLDDIAIFFIAMFTLEMSGVTTKYSRVSRFIGGILMFLIGLLLIFKPEILMFG